MTHNFHRWLIVAIIVILAGGMALTLWSVQREDNLQRTDLLTKTRYLSKEINARDLVNLTELNLTFCLRIISLLRT